MKKTQFTCRCEAYPFPHRLYGGKCQGNEGGDDDNYDRRKLERSLLGCSFEMFTNPQMFR